ncbi:threonine/serine exporter family protein [Candidatus Stoquefichus sp. SB1]|uniref:threonine/serine exporter family protein n=1 Tax=Candidatus Stoquefichus sp. SB1 TaxID=1658109 RepID=UPI00067EB03F|nr:threonine/serine exporter family protein [Candidatus Stoquefichus sp. SB1]
MNDIETLELINEIGYLLLKHGAEIYRVEESLQRMCEGLGFQNVEVFAIPTYFTLSLTLHDGTPYHSSKRSRTNRTHLDHLYELNNLVRKISNQELDASDIRQKINEIKSQKLNFQLILIGYIVSAAMFCLFFGGGFNEMIVSAFIGFVLYFFIYLMEMLNMNGIVRTILSSMVLSTIAIIALKMNLIADQQSVITGTLMLLVPGIAITNSLRDIIGGDFVSGLSRMIEAILIAASIAIGVGIMMMLLKGA